MLSFTHFCNVVWLIFNFSLQCFDTVGLATGRASNLYKNWVLVCWWCHFDWGFACVVGPVVNHHLHHP